MNSHDIAEQLVRERHPLAAHCDEIISMPRHRLVSLLTEALQHAGIARSGSLDRLALGGAIIRCESLTRGVKALIEATDWECNENLSAGIEIAETLLDELRRAGRMAECSALQARTGEEG